MSKFYNNVKSRLNKKGIKGLIKSDYLLAAEYLGIEDLDNATTEQIIAGVDYLTAKQATQLVSTVKNLETLSADSIEYQDAEESIPDSEVFQSITPLEEVETQSYEELYEDEVNAMPAAVNYAPLEVTQVSHSLAVTNADKQALVSTQSMALGFELSEQECLVVADNVDDVFRDYSSFLTSVTSAIRGYVDHRFDEVESALDTNADAVRSHIANRATKLNQKVENFSTNVKADIGGIRQHIKSSQSNILSRFTLPSKAG